VDNNRLLRHTLLVGLLIGASIAGLIIGAFASALGGVIDAGAAMRFGLLMGVIAILAAASALLPFRRR
jgi:hypothetical protein